jgi:hypothetical protein
VDARALLRQAGRDLFGACAALAVVFAFQFIVIFLISHRSWGDQGHFDPVRVAEWKRILLALSPATVGIVVAFGWIVAAVAAFLKRTSVFAIMTIGALVAAALAVALDAYISMDDPILAHVLERTGALLATAIFTSLCVTGSYCAASGRLWRRREDAA